jgi:hypothetical protein
VRRPQASRPAAAPAQRRPAGPPAARNNGPGRAGVRNARPQRGNARGPAPVADRQQWRARFSGGRYRRATNLNISIRVGTAVPRNRVTFYTVTPDIIRYYPRYRGYKFFLIDDEIIIVNPRTFEIVEIIEL